MPSSLLSSFVLAVGLAAATACGASSTAPAEAAPAEAAADDAPVARPARIVALGGPVTETLFALGAGSRVVGVDLSSLHPEAATRLPRVGYYRQFSAEGVLSLRPDVVIASDQAGPPAALEHLRASGVPVLEIPAADDLNDARANLEAIAAAAGVDAAEALRLRARLERDLEGAQTLLRRARSRPRVLFVYARGPGRLLVGGRGTPMAELIALAGADNAGAAIEGMRPWSAEAVIDAAPEIVLLPSRGLDSVGGEAGLLALPGLAQTPAGRERRIVAIDDLKLLGFGPRIGEGLRELVVGLHPEVAEGPT
ncbi:MAG: ABC transporter substrate-binding protein [Nannocystaceae bacterium]